MGVGRPQIIKSLIGAIVGALPGIAFVYYAAGKSGVAPYVVLALGTFIGFALTLPGVSAANVARGTAGLIAANNVSPIHREKVLDVFLNAGKSSEPDAAADKATDEPKTPQS